MSYVPPVAMPAVGSATARSSPAHEPARRVIPPAEWDLLTDDIEAIQHLKIERNAVVLAHHYQAPQVFHCAADIVGDSLTLLREATLTDADVIVLAGSSFLAETVKLVVPGKTVLVPDFDAGEPPVDSLGVDDVRAMRGAHPGLPLIACMNTSAAVKAETDVCCTASNARKAVESFRRRKVIMLPGRYLAQNVAAQTGIEIVVMDERTDEAAHYTAADVAHLRKAHPDIAVLAHLECPPEVVRAADFSGSTSALADYVGVKQPRRVALLTPFPMNDNMALQYPKIAFVRSRELCPGLKRASVADIRRGLELNQHAVEIDAGVAARARVCVDRMMAL